MKIVGFWNQPTPTLHIEEVDIQIGSLTIDYRTTKVSMIDCFIMKSYILQTRNVSGFIEIGNIS